MKEVLLCQFNYRSTALNFKTWVKPCTSTLFSLLKFNYFLLFWANFGLLQLRPSQDLGQTSQFYPNCSTQSLNLSKNKQGESMKKCFEPVLISFCSTEHLKTLVKPFHSILFSLLKANSFQIKQDEWMKEVVSSHFRSPSATLII